MIPLPPPVEPDEPDLPEQTDEAPESDEPAEGEETVAEAPGTAPPARVVTSARRLGSRPFNWLVSLVGLPWQRRLGWGALQVPRVRYWEKEYEKLNDTDLK